MGSMKAVTSRSCHADVLRCHPQPHSRTRSQICACSYRVLLFVVKCITSEPTHNFCMSESKYNLISVIPAISGAFLNAGPRVTLQMETARSRSRCRSRGRRDLCDLQSTTIILLEGIVSFVSFDR